MMLFSRWVNIFVVYIICGVLTGAYAYEYITKDMPCPLCFLQRFAMIGICIGLLLNVRFYIKKEHYAVSYFSAIYGAAVSLRQISLHICPDEPTFGIPVLGIGLYTWAFIVFASTIFGISLLLFFYKEKEEHQVLEPIPVLGYLAFLFVFILTIMNMFTVYDLCQWSLCADA